MSMKSLLEHRFQDRDGFRIVDCPKHMRPTAESIMEMGERISFEIKRNERMRNMSLVNASMRIVG